MCVTGQEQAGDARVCVQGLELAMHFFTSHGMSSFSCLSCWHTTVALKLTGKEVVMQHFCC